MNTDDPFTAAELGLVRYLRSLDKRTKKAIYVWLLTGDDTLLRFEFNRPRLKAAA